MTDNGNNALPTWRDLLQQILPRWLAGGTAQKVGYALGLFYDGLTDWTVQGVKARWPDPTVPDALALIGRERQISRGPNEDPADYVVRLSTWLDDHRTRGGPYALLQQLQGFWQGFYDAMQISLVNERGVLYTMNRGSGAVTRGKLSMPYDGDITHWGRWWLLYQWPTTVTPDGLWSDLGNWDDGGVWDSDFAAETIAQIRQVPHEWNAAHTRGFVAVIEEGLGLWDFPAGTWGDGSTWDSDSGVITIAV